METLLLDRIYIDWRDIGDIALVSFLLYQVIQHLRGSRALAVLMGLFILAVMFVASKTLGFYTLSWLLDHIFSSLFLVIVIIFQQDIRHALGEIGASSFFKRKSVKASGMEEIVIACEDMAKAHIGALIVIEGNMRLDDMIKREGVSVDAKLSRQLLKNIFYPKAPLHDGAVIISRSRIWAAACILPLAEAKGQAFGTRHRAALGITEETDATVVVVSEERGEISLASKGILIRNLTSSKLRSALNELL